MADIRLMGTGPIKMPKMRKARRSWRNYKSLGVASGLTRAMDSVMRSAWEYHPDYVTVLSTAEKAASTTLEKKGYITLKGGKIRLAKKGIAALKKAGNSISESTEGAMTLTGLLKDLRESASPVFPGETLTEGRDHPTILVRDMKLKGGGVVKAGTKVKINFPTHADQAKQAFFTVQGERKPKGIPSQKLHQYFRGFTKPPSMSEVSKWMKAGTSKSLIGMQIKDDGAFDKSGVPSWLLVLGYL